MAAITKGTPVFIWGLDESDPTNAVLNNISLSKTYANVAVATNASGNVVGKRMDDRTYEGTATLQFETLYAPESMGANLSFTIGFDGASVTVYITGVSESHTNGGFREITYNVKSSEFITL